MRVKLTEICTPKQWKTIPANELLDKGYPVYGANGIIGYYNEYNHENPVVAITCRGATCGTINITVPQSYVTGNAMCLDDTRSDILPEYLYYCLLHYDFNNVISGSAQPQITRQGLEKVEIKYYPIEAQKKIVAILSKTRAVITAHHQQLQKLDELVKARFIEMFGDCLSNPKGWKTKCLEDIAEVGSSKRVFVEELREDGIPFYRGTEVGALAEGKQITPELFITEQHYAELCKATGTPRIGDLLMPSICPDGRIWLVNTDKPFYFKDGRVLWVHAIDTSYNPVFLLYTLKDRIMTDYSSIASGTTFAELKIFALKKCQVFDVPITLQNEFAAFIKQTDKSKVVVQKALDEAQLLFDSLMQQYFG